jgi:16S rRNA (uracil1498-N3)-methyltransferase
VVEDVTDFATVAALVGACLADAGGGPPSLALPVVLVGPEGGWSEEERAVGLPAVGLGPHVLRAETAALAAGALLAALRAGHVHHAGSLPPVR